MLGIFETINKLTAMAEDPAFAQTGEKLVKAAAEIPFLLKTIAKQNAYAEQQREALSTKLNQIHGTLVEISLGLDNLTDPIARPAFKIADVEAAMSGAWPPASETQILGGLAPTLDNEMGKLQASVRSPIDGR